MVAVAGRVVVFGGVCYVHGYSNPYTSHIHKVIYTDSHAAIAATTNCLGDIRANMAAPDPDDELKVSMRFDEDEYYQWANQVPRDKSLVERVRELLAIDADTDIEAELQSSGGIDPEAIADADDIDIGEARVAGLQISRRCSSAVQDARANDAEKAAEQIIEIKNIADSLVEAE